VRIWDSLEWEDELQDDLNVGINATGTLDSTQTRQVLHLACTKYIYIFSQMYMHMHDIYIYSYI
jgi:predicted PP-loop superfamily ATPase